MEKSLGQWRQIWCAQINLKLLSQIRGSMVVFKGRIHRDFMITQYIY